MNVLAREVDDALVIEFDGGFPDSDREQADVRSRFAAAIPDAAQPRRLIVVLPAVPMITSHQLGLVVGCYVTAHKKLSTFLTESPRIVASSERIRSVFEVVDSPFGIYATLEDALRD